MPVHIGYAVELVLMPEELRDAFMNHIELQHGMKTLWRIAALQKAVWKVCKNAQQVGVPTSASRN